MQKKLQVTYRGYAPTEAIDAHVRARAEKLEAESDRILGCHVTLEIPHRHKRHGFHHHVRIELAMPGEEIVVSRDPAGRDEHENLYRTIDDAFADARRMLRDHRAMRRERTRRAVNA